MKLAFLIIDMQKAFYKGDVARSMDLACEYINYMIPLFRHKTLPIIWIQDTDPSDGTIPGLEGFDIIDSLKPEKTDLKIIKNYGNAFNKTELKDMLKDQHIDTLILSGYCAENCVLSTYRGALDYDFSPVIYKGSLASGDQENIIFVEKISQVISYQPLKKIIEIL
ncbi:MAG: cysteine hydrolase [Alphaproteobacteria bacterium]|nr:cysteine hydrolase [Alphaproteobacteria bacterium]